MPYFKRDVGAKVAIIRAAVPWAGIETWQDYGWRLTVSRPDGQRLIVMQPQRDADEDFDGQDEINLSTDEAISFLKGAA